VPRYKIKIDDNQQTGWNWSLKNTAINTEYWVIEKDVRDLKPL
jgi:hypothetical protein